MNKIIPRLKMDFPIIFDTLEKKERNGWIVLEIVGPNDAPFPEPFKSVTDGRKYLKERIGI